MSRPRLRAWLAASAALLVATAALAAVHERERLRHVALPVWDDPSLPAAAPRLPIAAALPATTLTARAQLPSRVTAIVETGGVVFVATFDGGVFRQDPARSTPPVAVGGLRGRERFVDALVAWDGGVVAGTHAGAIALDAAGTRRATWAAGEAVTALAVVDGQLLLGTAHGPWAGTPPLPLPLHGPDGEAIRVTALAASGRQLYLGSPSGLYLTALPPPPPGTATARIARYCPLVFGTPAASSNVVTALAALPDGAVLAGTDDGGAVLVSAAGAVHALPFADAAANGINPGAAVATADGAVLLGTEGGGLVRLAIDSAPSRARASRPAAWPAPQISAIASDSRGRLLLGAADGTLFTL